MKTSLFKANNLHWVTILKFISIQIATSFLAIVATTELSLQLSKNSKNINPNTNKAKVCEQIS